MTFLRSISTRTQLIKASLLALAAVGFAFPEVAQSSISLSTDVTQPAVSILAVADTSSAISNERAVLDDGDYLFGQSSEPGVNGSVYTVLSVQNNQTVGVFYQPNSSFDCFYGEMQPNQLAVNVVDSYNQTVYPYDVALTLDNSLIAGNGAGAYTLEGFHRLEGLSTQDLDMLAVCQADFVE